MVSGKTCVCECMSAALPDLCSARLVVGWIMSGCLVFFSGGLETSITVFPSFFSLLLSPKDTHMFLVFLPSLSPLFRWLGLAPPEHMSWSLKLPSRVRLPLIQ